MAFQNQQNKQNDSVNTRGFQFFNRDGVYASTLILGLWNQLITLKIHPAKEKSKQTESSVYDYDKSINLVIPPDKAILISKIMKEKVIPALNKGEECTISVAVTGSSVLTMSTGVKKFGKIAPYIKICRGVQPQTLIAEETMGYAFAFSLVIPDYDGDSKSDAKPIQVYSEMYYFVDLMKELAVAIVGGADHARRYINRKFNTERYNLFKAIAANINAPFYEGSKSSGSGRSATNVWGNGSVASTAPTTYQPQPGTEPSSVESISSLDDFM